MTFMDNKGHRRRIRWEFLWILLAILLMSWFLSGAEVSFSFDDVMAWYGVHDEDRLRRLVVLALCMVGIVAVLRVLADRTDTRR